MNLPFKLWQSLALMVVFMLKISIADAAAHAHSVYCASLIQENQHPVLYSVIQFGMPGNQTFVFCRDQDCQPRKVKHIAVADKPFIPPLKMPDPVKAEPEVLPVLQIDLPPPKPEIKQINPPKRKPVKKQAIKCEPEK